MFDDRIQAGRRLARRLTHLAGRDVVVLGLPRGGVPVAHEVAKALGAPLDVIVVRKLGVPSQPELAMGAIGEGGVRLVDPATVRLAGVSERALASVEERERAELDRRARLFRGDRPPVSLDGKIAVIVDDGIATGSTARAAARVARALGASRVVVATPVAPREVMNRLGGDADEVVVVETPEPFYAIGQFYRDFTQTSDREVTELLREGAKPRPASVDDEIEVAVDGHRLGGRVTVPSAWKGIVIFAHGSGSSRHSPRNRRVADALNRAGFGTLLFDLLSPEEEHDRHNVFDIDLLGRRLVAATRWMSASIPSAHGRLCFFGASTGAAAALWAAAELGGEVAAVVSRGGRPDLAAGRLDRVEAPTLLIVGAADRAVLELNREAARHLRCEHHLEVVPGAGHLFEEPGALETVADLAADWFARHVPPRDLSP
ncbi:MAG TPA: phosphoribosyltransferase family protein [Acidimicrobiia bacterium]|nr:phosphoribosyltransferase family protein [Acidimicrobiia bacterium]